MPVEGGPGDVGPGDQAIDADPADAFRIEQAGGGAQQAVAGFGGGGGHGVSVERPIVLDKTSGAGSGCRTKENDRSIYLESPCASSPPSRSSVSPRPWPPAPCWPCRPPPRPRPHLPRRRRPQARWPP